MPLTGNLYLIFHVLEGGGVSFPCHGILTHLSLCFEGWVIIPFSLKGNGILK